MRVSRWLIVAAIVLAAIGGGAYWMLKPAPSITVASWGEDYGRAQIVALFHPFTDKSGVDVDAALYGGGLKEIRAQVDSGAVAWDVVDFELADAAQACREGLLERIGDMPLPPGANGVRANLDFVPEALGPCWVGSAVYSQMIAYDPVRFADPPMRVADFFDLARFPGSRGLRDSAQYTLELALLGDGVPPQRVYATLETPGGADRAFAKLDSIKHSIVWWHKLSDALEALESGDVTMTTAMNGRVYDAVMAGKDIGAFWDGQLYQLDVFGIPKGSANKKLAQDFISFATAPERLAEEARLVPYGPARRSAIPLVGTNDRTGVTMRPYLPTAPENFQSALAVDPDWWAAHGAALQARWAAWRKQ